LDQRLIKGGELKKLKDKGIEVHARSIFLQGLLLMDPDTIHPFFNEIRLLLQKYKRFLYLNGLSFVEGAIEFIKKIPEIDHIIVGVNNLEQLKDNIQSFNRTNNNLNIDSFKEFYINEPKFINPSLWKLN
jgi:aryl-alcohol dehydrogenase-like predicted oxidoreductase